MLPEKIPIPVWWDVRDRVTGKLFSAKVMRHSLIGRKHASKGEDNQDSHLVLCEKDICVAIVADGAGRHAHPKAASFGVVRGVQWQIKDGSRPSDVQSRESWFGDLIRLACQEIPPAQGGEAGEESHPTTTFCGVCVWPDGSWLVGNVGDSRAGLLRAGEKSIKWITKDHVIFERFLLKALSKANPDPPDTFVLEPLQREDVVVLCTDGVYKQLTNDQIVQLILTNSDKQANPAARIVEAALAAPAGNDTVALAEEDEGPVPDRQSDDATVIVIKIGG